MLTAGAEGEERVNIKQAVWSVNGAHALGDVQPSCPVYLSATLSLPSVASELVLVTVPIVSSTNTHTASSRPVCNMPFFRVWWKQSANTERCRRSKCQRSKPDVIY